MQERNSAVVDLDEYRQERRPAMNGRPTKTGGSQQQKEVIDEIAHHLLIVIQALKKFPH